MNTYTQRAQNTKAIRSYPTTAQKEAYKVLVSRDGRSKLTQAQCEALASHPYLTVSQRNEFAAMATSVNWN